MGYPISSADTGNISLPIGLSLGHIDTLFIEYLSLMAKDLMKLGTICLSQERLQFLSFIHANLTLRISLCEDCQLSLYLLEEQKLNNPFGYFFENRSTLWLHLFHNSDINWDLLTFL